MARLTRSLVVLLAAGMAISACGRRSPLETPVASPSEPGKDPAGRQAYKPFILDPLLR